MKMTIKSLQGLSRVDSLDIFIIHCYFIGKSYLETYDGDIDTIIEIINRLNREFTLIEYLYKINNEQLLIIGR